METNFDAHTDDFPNFSKHITKQYLLCEKSDDPVERMATKIYYMTVGINKMICWTLVDIFVFSFDTIFHCV